MKALISARFLSSPESKPGSTPFEVRDTRLRGFILRVQPSGKRIYYAQVARGRRVTLGNTDTLTPDEARDRCTKALGNVAHGRAPTQGFDGANADEAVTLGRFIGEPKPGEQLIEGSWLHWAKVHRRKSWRKTLYAVKRHYAKWFDLPLASITPKLIETHMTTRLAEGAKPSSVRRDCDALAGILTRAVKFELLSVSPMKKVEKPKLDARPKVRFLSVDEERRLRQALADRDKEKIAARENANKLRVYNGQAQLPRLQHFGDHLTVAVLLSMLTGMRLSELLRLRWSDITTLITLEETKGVDTRHQPIVPEAKLLLRKWREQTKPTEDDHVIPVRDNLKKGWKALLKRARITKFRWNDLRHTYASVIMQEGGNLNTVRELLGHKEIRTTLRYAHLGQEDKNAAAALWDKRLKRVEQRARRDA